MSKKLNQTNTLRKFVECLRKKHSDCFVPDFEPKNARENARVLFLFEKPGRMTDPNYGGSGFISQDNDDFTAEATKDFLAKAGIDRKHIVIWNCIAGWNGTRKITAKERKEGIGEIKELLRILSNLEAIVFVGAVARKFSKDLNLEGYKVAYSILPSPINRATKRKEWKKIPDVWATVKPQPRRCHRTVWKKILCIWAKIKSYFGTTPPK